MKKRLLAILTVSLFLASSLTVIVPAPIRAASSGTVAFDYYHHPNVGNQTFYRAYGYPQIYSDEIADRVHLVNNLTAAGFTVVNINDTVGITSGDLANVNALFLGKISDTSLNYSASEIQAIKTWFQTGGKLLMVSGDSDYTSNETAINGWHASITNHVLSAIGSQLRLENGEITDQVNAGGAPYKVYAAASANGINSNGWTSSITANTQQVGFHGTTSIICYTNGAYVKFDSCNGLGDTVNWLYRSSTQGTLQIYGTARPFVTPNATAGQWVLAGAEKIPEGGSYSKVVVAGAGFYGNFVINRDTEFGVKIKYDGIHFVVQAVQWGTTVESVPINWTLYIAIAAVAIIVVVAAGLFLMRRKPKAPAATPS